MGAMGSRRFRRVAVVVCAIFISVAAIVISNDSYRSNYPQVSTDKESAITALEKLDVKGRAPKTGYSREQFGDGWEVISQCDMRNLILKRDMINVTVSPECKVLTGILDDPYTAKRINFSRGADTSDDVQIDHVVALSDAWQKGAQQLTYQQRVELANDPIELLAVDGQANQQKGDSDAATWLPPNKSFRCQYIARQIAVKRKYSLWVTEAERAAMKRVLDSCPAQPLPES